MNTLVKNSFLFLACFLISFPWGTLSAQEEIPPPKPLRSDDPKGLELPPGVPRMVDTNGNVISIDHQFTTPQYQRAAAQLLLQEANRVAEELGFPDEALPITASNVTELYVAPFGYNYFRKAVGVISTSNYVYLVSRDNKFSELVVAGYDQTCLSLKKTSLPLEQMDTNAAYQLATQWLATVSMDVNALNRDCKAHVAVSAFWNGLSKLGRMPRKDFVPIYYVWWTSPENDAKGFGGVARVELCLPTKRLLQLSVDDPKYILRKPLIFTNLASLFPGIGRVIVFTNAPGPVYTPGKGNPHLNVNR